MELMSWRMPRSAILPLAGALLVSVAALLAVGSAWREARQAEAQVRRHTGLILTTTRVLATLLEAETALRGFLLTSDSAFLEPYHAARTNISPLLKTLRDSEGAPPLEKAELVEVERRAANRMELLNETVKAFSSEGMRGAAPVLPRGKAVMDDLRYQIQRLQQGWLGTIAAQSDRVAAASDLSLTTAILGCVGTAGLMLAAAWQLQRSLGETRLALASVQEGEERYQLLAQRLQQIREEESGQLARRVHDELGQAMTAIRFDLSAIRRKLGSTSPEIQEQLAKTIELADDTVKIVRNIALDLRPGVLDQLGVVAALEWSGLEFQKRYGVKVTLESDVDAIEASRDQQLALFRIAQEALTNVARHAQATHVTVRVQVADARAVLEIADNGSGIPREKLERPRTVGLLSMQERARLAGAEWHALTSPGAGTTIRVILPLNPGGVAGDAQARVGG
jgi:signal transduction histidine kinase